MLWFLCAVLSHLRSARYDLRTDPKQGRLNQEITVEARAWIMVLVMYWADTGREIQLDHAAAEMRHQLHLGRSIVAETAPYQLPQFQHDGLAQGIRSKLDEVLS